MADNRGLVNRKAFSNSIRKDLAERFEKIHKQTRLTKSALLDEALEYICEKYEKEGGKS